MGIGALWDQLTYLWASKCSPRLAFPSISLRVRVTLPPKMGPIPPEIMYFLCIVTCFDVSAMYLKCISSVVFGAFGCLVSLCIVYVIVGAWSCIVPVPGAARLCYYIDTCGGIDFLQYWTIQCRIQVSYMYQMYCESLGGISVVSQLALMSARCLGRRDLPTLLAYYPYYCILPLPPTPASYYPYYPCLLPLLPLLPLLHPTTPYYPSTTPRTAYYP